MLEGCDICQTATPPEKWLDISLCGLFDANVARCGQCGFRQVRPRLSRDEIAALYPGGYFDTASPIGFADYARQQQRHEREAFFLARRLEALAPKGRLLEVGCALGFLLEAIGRFTSWEVRGVDISPTAARFAREAYGLEVDCGTLEEASFPEGHFDFIVQKDVLEHVARPREHLLETRRILRQGGRVLIVTPNGEANLRPLETLSKSLPREELPLLDQGHLSFFTRQHLTGLFAECGFDCLRARSLGIRRGLRALRCRGPLRMPPAARRGHVRNSPGAVVEAPGGDGEDIEEICRRLLAEVGRRQSRLRSWKPYVYFREGAKRLSALPAWLVPGHDFEFLLERQ